MSKVTMKRGMILIICLILQPLTLFAEFSGGTGDPNDPYQIATVGDLMLLGESPEYYNKHFILTSDIDLYPNLPSRKIFSRAVISPDVNAVESNFQGTPFTGVFNGNGHTISYLTIQSGTAHFLGLFGKIDEGGRIHNLRIENASIRAGDGSQYIGVLAGYVERCSITNCSSTGLASIGTNAGSLGGLVGYVWFGVRITQCSSSFNVYAGDNGQELGGIAGTNGGILINCYASGNVQGGTGCNYLGGLVGHNDAIIHYEHHTSHSPGLIYLCYAVGKVSGGIQSYGLGGLVGEAERSYIGSSFWDIEASGISTSAGGVGICTAEMQDANSYTAARWDFVGERANGTADLWLIPKIGGYPILTVLSETFQPPELYGNGTEDDPYRITTAGDLGAINQYDHSAYYKLTQDIDLSGITWSTPPIVIFDGTLDGAGFVISKLKIQGVVDLGLFGSLGTGAVIRNLGITSADIIGEEYSEFVGGLAGQNNGHIIDCSVDGYTGGVRYGYIGGLVGYNNQQGTITDSNTNIILAGHSDPFITGGGLVGLNKGKLVNSYACAETTGYIQTLGGLVGSNYGDVSGCYASGQLTGNDLIGGLVGGNSGTISDSYAIVDVHCISLSLNLGGLVGYNIGKVVNCYSVGSILNKYPEDSFEGGLIGSEGYTDPNIINCFWNTEISGIFRSDGGMGLTTNQMMDPKVYSLNGWAGNPNWILDPGNDYPRLVWENKAGQIIPEPVIDWLDGSGTKEDPFIIDSADQFARIGTASILWDEVLVLASDLDLAGINVPRIGVCLGTDFAGTFDGGNHVISNLTMGADSIPAFSFGLFGHIGSGGYVHDLILQDAIVKGIGVSDNVGIFAGANQGKITNCSANGNVSFGVSTYNLGGLVGRNCSGAEISFCHTGMNITIGGYSHYIGGLIGFNESRVVNCNAEGYVSGGKSNENVGGLVGLNNSEIVNCYADVDVAGSFYLGGLIGYNIGSSLNCYSTGNVTGGGPLGGLVGKNSGYITSSYSTSSVIGGYSAGGLVGCNQGGTVLNSYSTGSVEGIYSVGGLVGLNDLSSSIIMSYSFGIVSGDTNVGGLVGRNQHSNTLSSFWNVEASGQPSSAGGIGKTTAEMQTALTFLEAGWDFVNETENGAEDFWWINEGQDYPRLWWETE
ncbi:MAG: hypothetical protein JXA81_15600 [Sedimentisphaerales bacterium]|nr:hypothetical protein [Sedimentisphaerales bacterium]